jgi:hypothetical protein
MLLANNVESLLFTVAVDVLYQMSQAMNGRLICTALHMAQTEIYECDTLVFVCLIEIINFRFP